MLSETEKWISDNNWRELANYTEDATHDNSIYATPTGMIVNIIWEMHEGKRRSISYANNQINANAEVKTND
jgi:hypothetical protein